MAVVKDTRSFIESSRRVHGERYDYSLSDWNGPGNEIVVICRVCGPFKITADSHYRKGCGCRECALKTRARRQGSYQVCPYCRKWAKYRGSSRACRQCVKTGVAKKIRQKHYEKLMRRVCESCGKQFIAQRKEQKICKQSCHKKQTVLRVRCCVCAKQFYKQEQKILDRNCCSQECQRNLALVENRGKPYPRKLPVLNSMFFLSFSQCKRCTDEMRSVRRAFYRLLERSKGNTKHSDPWMRSVRSKLAAIRSRPAAGNAKSRVTGGLDGALNRMIRRSKWQRQGMWTLKIYNKLSNMKKRRRRKESKHGISKRFTKKTTRAEV